MSIKTSISIKTLQLQFKTLIQSWPIDRLRSHQSSLQFSNALSQIFNRFNLKFQDSNRLNSGVDQTHQLKAFNDLIETLQRIKDNRISSNVSFLSLFYYLDIAWCWMKIQILPIVSITSLNPQSSFISKSLSRIKIRNRASDSWREFTMVQEMVQITMIFVVV